ncbi:DUF4839 domain-containing protein [Streptomyces racemochromogenes]|uniref:DUF4839 domain-containing protein n=1 Tax=Streptomyces racemochromogenes TaxID=67353 RepID=A0ABW7PC09_9ACTN
MADGIKYEYKTVQTLRGTDGLVISKMQKDGWELVGQGQGRLRSTLDFRRPKKPLPRLLIGAAVGGLVILAAVIGVGAALEGGGGKKDESNKSTAATASAGPSAASPVAAAVITPQNNPEFAALLKRDSCDDANRDFATKHPGKTVAFDGSIVHMAPHGNDDTRYDFLLGPGDEGPKTGIGPAFKYQDANIPDLKLTGRNTPATVRAGDRFRFVAEVGEYDAKQCVFFLHPVSTDIR